MRGSNGNVPHSSLCPLSQEGQEATATVGPRRDREGKKGRKDEARKQAASQLLLWKFAYMSDGWNYGPKMFGVF